MKRFFSFFLLLAFATVASLKIKAQDSAFSGCGTNILLRNDEGYRKSVDALNNAAYDYLLRHQASENRSRSVIHYVPVVVHIIHNSGPENISNAQVSAAIANFNTNFVESDGTRIQFCLAQRDPNGNPTNGITRDVSTLTNETMEVDDLALKNVNRWPTTCYLNIWVVAGINSISMGSAVVGYATFPTSHGTASDGVVIEAAYFGSSPVNDAIGTHELGHYLGLYHTFEGGCPNSNCMLNGDMVCDTPPDQTTFSSCAPHANSCSTDTDDPTLSNPFTVDVSDLGNDYMDYSIPTCYNMFTAGQYSRMEFFLTNTRNSLLNCLSCSTPCPMPVTATITAPATALTLSTGSAVNFSGTFTNATGQTWYLSTGTTLSTASSFVHTFTTQGNFWMKYRAISADPEFCLDAIDSVQIIVTEPLATICEGSVQLTNHGSSVHLPATTDIYSSNGFTWECWVKLTDPFGATFRPIITAIDPVPYEDISLSFGWTGGVGDVPVTSLAFKVDGPSGPSAATCNYMPSGGFVLGTWYHVAATMNYTTQQGKLYLNGALVDTKTISSAPFTRNINAQLGWDPALNPFNAAPALGGHLDEIRIWTNVRSDSEIMASYDQCMSGTEAGLLIYYGANQSTGINAIDATSNDHHGLLNDQAQWSSQQSSLLTTNCASLCNSSCPQVLASADTSICGGTSVQIHVSGSFPNYTWSPATGLSDPTSPSPVASPTSTTTYTVTGYTLDSNLVVNHDFSLGNYGFTSGQTYSVGYSPCNYYVGPSFFMLSVPTPDHSPTSDNYYMSIDGCSSGPTVIWEQHFPSISSGEDYEFRFWASRADAVQPDFEIHAIGNVTGDIVIATQAGIPYSSVWTWDQYGVPVWNSGLNTSVTFRIVNLEFNGYGNDFGLDDFSFRRGCSATDEVTVSISTTIYDLDLGNDTAMCESGVLVLDGGSGFQQYLWENGDNGQHHTVYGPGTYWLTVTDPCGQTHSDTIIVSTAPAPTLVLASDTTLCQGDSIALSFTGSSFTSFNWTPDHYLSCNTCENPVVRPYQNSTIYLAASTEQGCTTMDSIMITVLPGPVTAFTAQTTDELCGQANGTLNISVNPAAGLSYTFGFNNTTPGTNTSFSDLVAGVYSLQVISSNGCAYDTTIIINAGTDDELFIPNCFSPNADGINDTWSISSGCGETISYSIFNRWGNKISDQPSNDAWNGNTSEGLPASDGVYYYVAEVIHPNGEKKGLSGFISLLR
jgi:gliding motility-associated-like protein